jgi:hypothetical protein
MTPLISGKKNSSSGVPVRLTRDEPRGEAAQPAAPLRGTEEGGNISAEAEAGLHSDAVELERQAQRARTPEDGRNILGGRRSLR